MIGGDWEKRRKQKRPDGALPSGRLLTAEN